MPIKLLNRAASPTHDPVEHYPDLAPLRQALHAEDWRAVVAFFDRLPDGDDPTVATDMVAQMRGVETYLRSVGGPAESPLAGTLLGVRLVMLAWEARGSARSQYTSSRRFASFHETLREAEAVLSEVTAADPGNIAAWTARLCIARGLEMGPAEANRRYERAVGARPHPFTAQLAYVQQLCPKWGGSLEKMHDFARRCAEEAPPGSLNAAAVAEAHLEDAFYEGTFHYLRRPRVLTELQDAVAVSVGHPDYRPVHGWVRAQSSLAMALWYAGDRAGAASRMATLDNRITEYPWRSVRQFRTVRRRLLRIGARG
ncbi:hypothetical protein ACN26Y_24620 [Micromonospora sp. WMMD558]|uniref:hypothetical protein n=1 Tax=Micromonospora sp. WMMD558 TaxID=3403462 RepID=UPI003BF4651A